ncbi:hypothetical protein LAZ67_3002359 [Cordylochernes scorpioides]|uniref:Uncharacterized protein n=1 Tax=Cordylochernes scorpioides TaxID=51811 RepID=A0ABY6K7S5_9ARAC|nr:hypothetical protein LAZ67_3002359 [Cordylochernes scorpioides]
MAHVIPVRRYNYYNRKDTEKISMAPVIPVQRYSYYNRKDTEKISMAPVIPVRRYNYYKRKDTEKINMAPVKPVRQYNYYNRKDTEKISMAPVIPVRRYNYYNRKDTEKISMAPVIPVRRYNYYNRLTVVVLIAFSIVVTGRQYIGDPIDCISKDDIGADLLDTFCWIHTTFSLEDAWFKKAAAQANRSWADLAEDNNPEHEDNYTTVQRKKRRRGSAESPAAAAPSSNIRGAGAIRRPRSSTGWAPRAEEIRTTRAHIAEARARQASSTEDHCVYVERSPELEPFHCMRAIERMFGSTREVFQRLVDEGLEVEGTLHRAFPFRKRAERITVGNLPFFVGDATVISALSAFGRVTSIAPKLMKAGPYIYNDGRREAFIILREGMTIEGLPTRLNITIKGEAWPAYLSSGIRCSRCRGQGHRRANCPLLAGRTNAPRPATPTSPTSVPPVTAPGLPQQPSAHPPPPASSSPAMETPSASPAARAVTPSAAPRPSTPVAPAVPVEMAPPAPPPVTPAPSLRAPGGSVSPQSTKSGPPAQDIEMPAIEESSASSTSSSRTSMRDDLVAFIQRSPTVSFTGTDALGLGREEVLDLLSSRTKAQRKRWLLTPPQTDALAGLIKQILGLKPAGNTNVYKILHQVKSELKKGPAAVPPTPPLPAPWPAEPAPPAPQERESTPAMATRCDELQLLTIQLMKELNLWPQLDSLYPDLVEAVLYPEDRKGFLGRLSPGNKRAIIQILDKLSEHTRDLHSLTLRDLSEFRAALPSDLLLK